MPPAAPNLHDVARLLEEVSSAAVMPRFRRLREGDVEDKWNPADPGDIVTAVDRLVEEELTRRLADFRGSGPVVGEEAAHGTPALLDIVRSDQAFWLLDPIDGTRNFARGDDQFGIMLAWVVAGRTRPA